MHNKIMRFNLFVNLMNPDPRGLYVRYEDHMAAMEAVKPSQCLHQIQEPPTKTEALAHYSQQAILAMGEAGAAQHVAADVPASGAVALTEYLKDCDQHSIVPDVGGAFASAFKAGFNLAASPAQATQPEVVEALRALHDSLELALKLGHLSERALEIIIMQPATDVPMRSSTLAQVDAAVAAPLPLLVRDIARELCISSVEACNALKPLGNYSTNTAVTAEMMAKLRECFPERVPASEVGGARERMTAGRACYFMERFLKEEKLLGPNEQAALHYVIDMLEAAAAPVVLPEPVAAIKEVMGLVELHRQEIIKAMDEEGSLLDVQTAQDAIEAKLSSLLAGVSAPAALATAEVELPDVEDMAHSAVQEALRFGVNHDVFHRWMRSVMDKTVAALTAPQAQADARDAIRELIAKHRAELEHNDYAYFELAYTRRTGWMAWITDKPLNGGPVINPDRKVLARGQGDTPEGACAAAIAAQAAQQTQGDEHV